MRHGSFLIVLALQLLPMRYGLPESMVEIAGAPSGTRYLYIDRRLAMNRADAEKACNALGYTLAPVPSIEDLLYIGGMIREEAWIGSFQGRHDGECIAAFRGGAVAVPVGHCKANHAILCGTEGK